MTTLDARDRRRAVKVWEFVCEGREADINAPMPTSRRDGIEAIAAALKREREETSRAAVIWFMFSGKSERARVKRACAKGSKPAFAAVKR